MRAVLTAVLAGLLVAGGVRADEQKVPVDQLPKAVAEAVKKRFPKAEVVDAAKETENGKTEYEVTVTDGKQKVDVTLTPAGVISLLEKTIAAADLPKAVADGLGAKYPKADIKTAEEVVAVADGKETLAYYEVLLVSADKKTAEVQVAADGTIKKVEDKTGPKD